MDAAPTHHPSCPASSGMGHLSASDASSVRAPSWKAVHYFLRRDFPGYFRTGMDCSAVAMVREKPDVRNRPSIRVQHYRRRHAKSYTCRSNPIFIETMTITAFDAEP